MKIRVHDSGVVVDAQLRLHLERRMAFALGGLGERVEQVVVNLSAESTRADSLKRCEIEVKLRPRTLRVADTGADLSSAVQNASARLRRSLARALERERAWPSQGAPPLVRKPTRPKNAA